MAAGCYDHVDEEETLSWDTEHASSKARRRPLLRHAMTIRESSFHRWRTHVGTRELALLIFRGSIAHGCACAVSERRFSKAGMLFPAFACSEKLHFS